MSLLSEVHFITDNARTYFRLRMVSVGAKIAVAKKAVRTYKNVCFP